MIRMHATALAAAALAFALPLSAQETPPEMTAEQKAEMEAWQKAGTPGPQHKELAGMVGTYDLTVKSWYGPGEPNVETGTATRSMALGGRVLVEEMQSSMHGQPFTGHGMHGYDNITGKYWSTWNDSMSTGLMVSEGSCDEEDFCTFTGTWHDAVTKQEVKARMTTQWTSPDVEVFEMYGPGENGREMKMMEITYTRRR